MVSSAIIEWPDGCLGVDLAGVACAQEVTPGYSILLSVNDRQVEYHTNGDASVLRPATLALAWHREGGIVGFCDDLSVWLPDAVHGNWCQPQAGTS